VIAIAAAERCICTSQQLHSCSVGYYPVQPTGLSNVVSLAAGRVIAWRCKLMRGGGLDDQYSSPNYGRRPSHILTNAVVVARGSLTAWRWQQPAAQRHNAEQLRISEQ